MRYEVLVEYANGEDFGAPRFFSHCEILADRELDARIMAQQLVWTPQPGKPAHIQITGTDVVLLG